MTVVTRRDSPGIAHFELPIILPEVTGGADACVERLRERIAEHKGIAFGHLEERDGAQVLCVHYDPSRITLAQVERLVRAAGADLSTQFGHAVLPLHVVGAEDEGRGIEAALLNIPGVMTAAVNLAAQLVRVEFDRSAVSAEAIATRLADLGVDQTVRPAAAPRRAIEEVSPWRRHRELIWAVVACVFVFIGWAAEQQAAWPQSAVLAVFAIGYTAGAFDLIGHTVRTWQRSGITFDIDLLMLLAAGGAAAIGERAEGGALLALFALAHALEHYALDRARRAISALADLAPPVARVERNGKEVEVPVEQVAVGDIVRVRPAERIPVDGVVVQGASGVNQAPVTGESVPADKGPDDEVYAGTINGEGALQVRTTRAVGDRTLDRVIKLVEEAQTQKAPTQQFSEQFARIFVPLVLAADVVLILVPPFALGADWRSSLYRGISLLVAASPCALAIGTPAAVLAGIARAARSGVLIKGGVHLENLGTLQAMAFDKTGTLTQGRPEVTDVVTAGDVDEHDLLRIAAGVEKQSQHPLAQAVVRRAEEEGITPAGAGPLESVTARGVRATVSNVIVEIGSARFWDERAIPIPPDLRDGAARLQSAGRSVMYTRHGERWLGVLGLADQPRESARTVLRELRQIGMRSLVLLTGDNRGVAEAVARELGIDDVRAELLPEDKVTAIRELRSAHGALAMVGDGINDAPALAQATVGIAMGGAGTAVALETADVALMADDLNMLPFAIVLSRRAAVIIRQNLWISLAVIAILVTTSVAGQTGMAVAVVTHEGCTLVVIGNALRLLR